MCNENRPHPEHRLSRAGTDHDFSRLLAPNFLEAPGYLAQANSKRREEIA